jgi:hypothetical protein
MTEKEEFDGNGILLGWWCQSQTLGVVFIPRRDEDIDEDRAAIKALFRRVR